MKDALDGRPEHRQPEPAGVLRMWVSRSTGNPTRAGASGAVFEAFLAQYAPDPGVMDYSAEVEAESVVPVQGSESIF